MPVRAAKQVLTAQADCVLRVKSRFKMGGPIRYPDFYVVGAPKCGTTSLYEYLRQHPAIFLPRVKEPHYFGDDLDWRSRVVPRECYAGLYADAPLTARAGDMSVFYLVSSSAAREIYSVRPDARIVIMLRDPIKMLPSLHAQALKTGDEILTDLGAAMDAEPRRRAGDVEIAQDNPGVMEMLYYSTIACYGEQVRRYFDVFGCEAVMVVLYEDFAADTMGTLHRVFRHISVDPGFEPVLERHNEGRRIRNATLWRALKHPPPALRQAWRRLVPRRLRGAALHMANDAIMLKGATDVLDEAMELRIANLYREDVGALEALIGRDLSGWLRPRSAAAP